MQTSFLVSNWREAEMLVKQLLERKEELANIKDSKGRPNYLGITFQGRYQDTPMIHAATVGIINELQFRIKELQSRLSLLGVYDV